MKKRYYSKKLKGSYEDLVSTNAKLRAIQEDVELDATRKDEVCRVIFEDFLRRLAVGTESAAKAMRDAKQALKTAKAVRDENIKVAEIIGGLLEPNEYEKIKNLGGKEL